MDWFVNACAVILIGCMATVMVCLTAAGVALLWSRVKKEVDFFERRDLDLQELNKLASDQFNAELNKRRQVGGFK